MLDSLERVSDKRDSDEYKNLVKQIADIRRRAANAIIASSNDSMPAQHAGLYWEKYDDKGKDPEFLVYTRFEITTAAERAMHRIYTEEKEVAGGKVLTGFPLLAWSHSDFEGGVLVTEATGDLEVVGVDALILTVDGQEVSSANAFDSVMKAGANLGLGTKVALAEDASVPANEPTVDPSATE